MSLARDALAFYAEGGEDGGARARGALEALEAPKPARVIDQAEVRADTAGGFYVLGMSSNGEPILWSESYRDRSWARRIAADLGVPVVDEAAP